MSARTTACIGFEVPGGTCEFLAVDSDRSLLDADIIMFQPTIPDSYYYHQEEDYRGKATLGQTASVRAAEAAQHWKSELNVAVQSGKMVVVFLAKPVEVFVHTGEKQYSGIGRNQKVTNIVRPLSSYDFLPFRFTSVVPRGGEAITPAGNLGPLAAYWAEFGGSSRYEVYVDGQFTKVMLTTRTGSMTVGALVRLGLGSLVFLPPIKYNDEQFINTAEDGTQTWTDAATAFGARLVAAIVALDKSLHGDREITPPPGWSQAVEYRLAREAVLEQDILAAGVALDRLQSQRAQLSTELEGVRRLRGLLYEGGRALEEAVLDALRAMGFTAEHFEDGESEFDAVLISPEGRFLGEVEGKDTKAINIDKLSQLERNIQEDFAREEVSEPAKGLLFGNPFRLLPPEERSAESFTAKCVSGARRLGVALVRTPDLFPAARYLKENNDPEYAAACRHAIHTATGDIVQFPPVPRPPEGPAETTTDSG